MILLCAVKCAWRGWCWFGVCLYETFLLVQKVFATSYGLLGFYCVACNVVGQVRGKEYGFAESMLPRYSSTSCLVQIIHSLKWEIRIGGGTFLLFWKPTTPWGASTGNEQFDKIVLFFEIDIIVWKL